MKYLSVKRNFRANKTFSYSPTVNLSIALGIKAIPWLRRDKVITMQ